MLIASAPLDGNDMEGYLGRDAMATCTDRFETETDLTK